MKPADPVTKDRISCAPYARPQFERTRPQSYREYGGNIRAGRGPGPIGLGLAFARNGVFRVPRNRVYHLRRTGLAGKGGSCASALLDRPRKRDLRVRETRPKIH